MALSKHGRRMSKAGGKSERWEHREEVKKAANKRSRRVDKVVAKDYDSETGA